MSADTGSRKSGAAQRWLVSACPTCKRQADELDGGMCHDHEPGAWFEDFEVVAADNLKVATLAEPIARSDAPYLSDDCEAGRHWLCEDPTDCSCPCHEDDEG